MKFLKDLRINLAKKLILKKKEDIFLLDKIEIDLKGGSPVKLKIPPFPTPQNIEHQYFQKPLVKDYNVNFPDCKHTCMYRISKDKLPEISVFEIRGKLFCPKIKAFAVNLGNPVVIGMSYKKYERKDRVSTLFPVSDDKLCIHGIERKLCSICNQRLQNKKTPIKSNFFQLILPILQPPLGENFDNPIAFQNKLKLYPFKIDGVKFLANHKQAILGDEMGLGKSIQAIVAIRLLFRIGEIVNVIIVCPKSVLTDWKKKLNDWAPELKVVKICGTPEQRKIIWYFPAHVYLITYDTLRQDENVSKKDFDLVILDEIQKIKNPSSGIPKAVRQVNGKIRWGLSGTPLENHLDELVSIFAYIKPGLLTYNDVQNLKKIKDLINPFFLRRRKQDVLKKLPKKVYEEVWLELTPAQRKAYNKVEQEGIVTLKKQGTSVTVQHIWALISKLKQICNLDPISNESCKLEYLPVAIQAEDRTHRIGQKKTVFVSSLFTVNTIEERIQNILNKKKQLFKEVIDHLSDTRLSKILSEEDLFSLFNIKKSKSK
ncbi:DEAD/DEAH box helicase [Thermodesulfovibrio sp. Kuro-1]|uniref:DEAD/DEAH box helicase n=1 Tax=Thermodesulfovibrio sp. Kuro-1 TaxID=2580394 RepID=UPI00114350BB|nr:SNF2-related protein [Thermodesulfovibrio sp. Kuro-1]